MPNIVKGSDMAGLMRYLAGPGRAEEHTNPRVIAGDVVTMAVFGGAIDVVRAGELAKLLDSPRQIALRGAPVMATNYRAAYAAIEAGTPRREAFEAATKDENVWHCALALDPKEGQLDEATWSAISRRFMAEMGFIDAGDGAPDVRWATVHHGLTKAGGDHVHIAMSVVRPDGSLADVRRDWPRSQAAARVLEQEFGLKVLASREFGGTEQATRPDERARAVRVGAVETDREALRRRVRAAAVSTESEAEFVRELRAAGMVLRPRYAKDRTDEVTGYSIRMPAQKNLASGRWEKAIWFGGGHLAKDLTLSALRGWAGWEQSAQAGEEAVAEWGRSSTSRSGRSLRPDAMSQKDAVAQLSRWSEYMRTIPVEDRDAWAKAASQTAGLFAAASLRTETTPGPLDRLARQLARAAQMPAHQRRPHPVHGAGMRAVGRMLWAMKSPEAANLALVTALADCMVTITDMLAASGRATQAREMTVHARQALTEIHKRAAGVDPQRPHVRELGSPAWAAEQRTAAILARTDRAAVETEVAEQERMWNTRRIAGMGSPGQQGVDQHGHPVGPKPRKNARTFVVQRPTATPPPPDNAERITKAAIEASAAEAAAQAEAQKDLRRRAAALRRRAWEQPSRPVDDRGLDERFADTEDAPGQPPSPPPGKSIPPTRAWEQYLPPPVRPDRDHGMER